VFSFFASFIFSFTVLFTQQLFVCNPHARMSAESAMAHPFFDELKDAFSRIHGISN
jgi:hypothetical protein